MPKKSGGRLSNFYIYNHICAKIKKMTKQMERQLLLSASIVPSYVTTQNGDIVAGDIIFVVVGLVVAIVVSLLLRELNCWYWKINERVQNQEEIIRLLEIIVGRKGDKKDA